MKKLFTLLFCVFFVFVFSACGSASPKVTSFNDGKIDRENVVDLTMSEDSIEISAKSSQIGSANEKIGLFNVGCAASCLWLC